MSDPDMPLERLLEYLQRLAEKSLSLWDIPDNAQVRLINVSENATYLVEAHGGFKAILRVHRENYHSQRAIECELAWLEAIDRDEIVDTHRAYRGRNGAVIQQCGIEGLDAERYLVLFSFLDGDAPDETGDMASGFEELGRIAARCHDHVLVWKKPDNFVRLVWDADAVFGANPTWGNWRDAPGITTQSRAVLESVERKVYERLDAFGKSPERFNLIHADMRLANLLVNQGKTRLIDFDDCGYGWFLYDFAAAISFIEDDPRIPQLKAAWLRGYRSVRAIRADEEAEMDTFVMLRRMALLAWIGSHIEAPEPQALASDFAANTVKLGQAYMKRMRESAPVDSTTS